MFEFTSVSVSSFDPASLADRLTELSAQGWSVTAIVPTGSTVTAYCSRPAGGSISTATAAVGAAAVATVPAAVAPTPTPTVDVAPAVTDVAPAAAAEPAAASATTALAPAGWYADPSNRYELRYWDGSTWTEYVSRGGNQYTDPPVA